MNVAIVVKEFPPDVIGGTETQSLRMATALSERGHDVTVITKSYGQDHTDTDLPFSTVRIPNTTVTRFVSDVTFVVGAIFYLLLRARRFDVLQCMMVYPIGCIGYLVNRVRGLPYFAWVRGNDFYKERHHPVKRRMMRAVFADTRVLVQSPDVQRDVEEFFGDSADEFDLGILGNGVSIPDEHASPGDSEMALFLGRLDPKKGIEHLLRAVASLDRDADLRIVGDGSERERLELIAEELELEVEFVGEVPPDTVDRHYREAGMFVLPSEEGEGLPNAVLEAMSWGLPVVATDSGGLPTLVTDGKTGYVAPQRDVEVLEERIRYLLENSDRRAEMGNAARDYVTSKYGWNRICEALEGVFEDTVDDST